MSKVKLTKEEENAMRIQALLQGVSLEDLLSSKMNDVEDDIEIEIEDEDKPKKKSKKTAKNKDVLVQHRVIPELDRYKHLNKSLKLNVNYKEHDIHYKEQLWGMPSRTVVYNIELVKTPKIAKDISDIFNNKSAQERKKAEDGEVRYFKVVNHEENVSHLVREIAYIKATENNGKIITKVHVLSKVLKENNGNPDKVKDSLNKVLKDIVC